ncbi:uncharacterized protein LOC134957593 isoform X2 [Pseudophryne corroboree]|uniref:uncharacterized protein LOC134957593 isoform X2 n=1 Tax=Pseudophryne corroboree TaxID=495146 RepID=UPI0030820512
MFSYINSGVFSVQAPAEETRRQASSTGFPITKGPVRKSATEKTATAINYSMVSQNGRRGAPLQSRSLVADDSVASQSSASDGNKQNRTIPQWGTGLIAVAVFLFLVFAFYMANKIWNRPSKGPIEKSTVFDEVAVPNGKYVHHSSGFSEHEHEYDNPAADLDNDNELTTAM